MRTRSGNGTPELWFAAHPVPPGAVSDAFKLLVRDELHAARVRAHELLQLPVYTPYRPRVKQGTCTGCGCGLGERRRGCGNCAARHGARKRAGVEYVDRFGRVIAPEVRMQ